MQRANKILKVIFSLNLLITYLFCYPVNTAEIKNRSEKKFYLNSNLKVEKPVADHSQVLLRGAVDMFTYAYKEAGITLTSSNLPTTIRDVLVGSPAYYASVQKNDKLMSASLRNDKLCLSISRGNTPYYTEIRLSSESQLKTETPRQNQSPNMVAIGFRYFMGTGEVTYVDRKSDLFGKVHVGDIYMYLNGIESNNNGADASVVYPVFKQKDTLHFYQCRQKPVNTFAPDMAEKFRQDGFGIIHAP